MKNYLLLFLLTLSFACKKVNTEANNKEQPTATSGLLDKFRYFIGVDPLVSVHRGGKYLVNYPENCLETLKFINDSINAIYEIDIAQTKDSVLVLMHDNSIDRTTNGSGLVKNLDYKQLQHLFLVDDFGNQTKFKVPAFATILEWAKNNAAILTIDIKRSVNVEDVVNAVRKAKAEDISIIITYDLKQSLKVYELAPELMQSVSARNQKEFDGLLSSGIPTKNMLAFTGTRLSSDTLYQNIHLKGIRTILGTLGNLDNRAKARGDYLYNEWKEKGIDIIATDRPFEVAQIIKAIKK